MDHVLNMSLDWGWGGAGAGAGGQFKVRFRVVGGADVGGMAGPGSSSTVRYHVELVGVSAQ